MKSKLDAIFAAAAIAFSLAGHAQAQATPSAGASVAASAVLTEGEVRKVDKDAKKVTIKHGEIKNLDMPPMTMVFSVKHDAVLDKVKVGDKVRFKAVDDGGKLTVVEIQAAK
jgi:Cu/Ag efflux protein CusF